jgi:hypothetical protein
MRAHSDIPAHLPSVVLHTLHSNTHCSTSNTFVCCTRIVQPGSALQEHARDSFENLLFSLCRFFEITGSYPARVTAVSYTLKQQRFEQLHRAAVRFPADAFTFIGTPVS